MKKKILLADDERFFREMIKDVLTPAGYELIEAQDGVEALQKIKDQPPDLIITDLLLPKINGFDLIKEVRRDKAGQGIPILVITSIYKDTSYVMQLQSLGARDFIDKSFKPEQLLERVKRLLDAPVSCPSLTVLTKSALRILRSARTSRPSQARSRPAATAEQLHALNRCVPHRETGGHHHVIPPATAKQLVRVDFFPGERAAHCLQVALFQARAVTHLRHARRNCLAQRVGRYPRAAVEA